NALKTMGRPQSLENYVNVRTRRRRSNCLKPPLLVKAVYPGRNPGKRLHSIRPDEIAIQFLLGICDSRDSFRSGCGAKPLRNDRVVALAEGGKKLAMIYRNAFLRQSFPPGNPVELLRVDQCSIHVPKYRPHSHLRSFLLLMAGLCRSRPSLGVTA